MEPSEPPKPVVIDTSNPESYHVKLYCLGSAEINQFYIPYPEGSNVRRATSRRPVCLTDMSQFKVIENPEEPNQKITMVPNPIYRQNLTSIACGGTHTLALTSSGRVFSWGANDDGALGRPGEESIPLEVEISSDSVTDIRVDQICAGDSHSLFLNSKNSLLFFCGVYKGIIRGNLGSKVQKPVRVPEAELGKMAHKQIKKICSGVNHTLLQVDEHVLIRGDTEYFISGRKTSERRRKRQQEAEKAAHKAAYIFQDMGLKGVTDVWAGSMHCFAKTTNKHKGKDYTHYYAWGNNGSGQLGLGHTEHAKFPEIIKAFEGQSIKKIVGGEMHSIFLTQGGDVYACGKNDDGQLGLGQNQDKESDNEKEDQKANEFNTPKKLSISDAVDIGTGLHYSFAITGEKDNHSLYSWGLGTNYVLITGTQDERFEPYKVSTNILNHERVKAISGGAQHTVYLTLAPGSGHTTKEDASRLQAEFVVQKGKLYGKIH